MAFMAHTEKKTVRLESIQTTTKSTCKRKE